MFGRKAIGLEISQDRVRTALISGSRMNPVFEGGFETPLPLETVRVSLREPNILQPAAFVAAIRQTSLQLLANTARTAVALPDAAGRVMLLDLDTRFKSRDEAADVIRWKLKKNFPFDINDAHFDFQTLQERESGEVSVLVSLVCRQVLNQYEDLIVEAGLEPTQIDFTPFNVHELFAQRLSVDESYSFVCYFAGVISLLIFREGLLEFYRSKEIPGLSFSANRVFRELSSSLLVFQDKNQGSMLGKVFCFVAPEQSEEFRSLTAEATGQEPVMLDVERIITRGAACTSDRSTVAAMTAAMGAAVRVL